MGAELADGLYPAPGKDTTDLASKEITTKMVRQKLLKVSSTVQYKSPWSWALLLLVAA